MQVIQSPTEAQLAAWEQLQLAQDYPQFLQSLQIIAMHSGLGDRVIPVLLEDSGVIVAGAMTLFVEARRGTYLYVQYGPLLGANRAAQLAALTAEWKRLGHELGADFIRVCPFVENTPDNAALFAAAGFRRAPIHMLAEHIWWLDITADEPALQAGMRKTMRNLIRRSSRDGVTIEQRTDQAAVEDFILVHADTMQRHGFVPYPDDYFRQQFAAFAPQGQAVLFLARYQKQVIAASMIMFYGSMASYHHGASLTDFHNIPSTYLLQWEAIQEAKRRGCTTYNFWGIAPADQPSVGLLKRPHPFLGVTKFKQGFGGQIYNLLPCQDLPLTSRYQLTRVIELARKVKRGFI